MMNENQAENAHVFLRSSVKNTRLLNVFGVYLVLVYLAPPQEK
jgi:hypothetical protein